MKYLDLIRSLPCVLTERPAECCHVRYADDAYGKPDTGMQRKPPDQWCLPLCPELHRLVTGCQHDSDERSWWAQFGVDPLRVCVALWSSRAWPHRMEDVVDYFVPRDPKVRARLVELLR